MANVEINGKICEFEDGQTILNIARQNDVYIPAICYLSGCSPTLACRMCLVEADGKRVYSCNTKAKDGMKVITNSDEIEFERNAIMQTYCINHPLECGVCDQSGECELQGFVHKTKVDKISWSVKDIYRPVQKWGKIDYDPSLCIVCERCVTVCSDKMGDKALKTIARGGEQPPKELKDTMPKDAYAVWTKFQKSLIGRDGDCDYCGECAAVCPVGALVVGDFKYTSNSWELTKIPASNPHSSDCELIFYDVKERSISDRRKKIYRVSNDFHFGELNPAARFGFDFHNENAKKDEKSFQKLVDMIKNGEINTIKFNSFITNEEAKILQILKETFRLNLVNDEAKAYQDFLNEFSKFSGLSLYNANLDSVKNSDFAVVCGSYLRSDSPNTSYKLNNALKMKKGAGFYFHHIADKVVGGFSKNFITCQTSLNVDIEVLLFILQKFGQNLPEWLSVELEKYYQKDEGCEVATSLLCKALNLDEAKFDELSKNRQNLVLIIGEDFYFSKNSKILAKLAGIIQDKTPFKVLLVPPRTNSLGVALICKLDDEIRGKVLGYNENGDFKFSVSGGDLDAPALNQQEGSFCNIDKRVVPTNAAILADCYELNDLANALRIGEKYTIDFTKTLCQNTHFLPYAFDDLTNFYDNGGTNYRGYELNLKSIPVKSEKFEIENLNDFSQTILYKANPVHQFSKFTNRASALNEAGTLIISSEFAKNHNINQGAMITLKNEKFKIALPFVIDTNLECEALILPFFDEKISIWHLVDGRFAQVEIEVNNG